MELTMVEKLISAKKLIITEKIRSCKDLQISNASRFKLEGKWHGSVWSVMFWIWKQVHMLEWKNLWTGLVKGIIKTKTTTTWSSHVFAKVRVTSGFGSWFKDLHLQYFIWHRECFSSVNCNDFWGSSTPGISQGISLFLLKIHSFNLRLTHSQLSIRPMKGSKVSQLQCVSQGKKASSWHFNCFNLQYAELAAHVFSKLSPILQHSCKDSGEQGHPDIQESYLTQIMASMKQLQRDPLTTHQESLDPNDVKTVVLKRWQATDMPQIYPSIARRLPTRRLEPLPWCRP